MPEDEARITTATLPSSELSESSRDAVNERSFQFIHTVRMFCSRLLGGMHGFHETFFHLAVPGLTRTISCSHLLCESLRVQSFHGNGKRTSAVETLFDGIR